MFNRLSRYRKLPAAFTPDSHGRAVRGTALRPLGAAPGVFQHAVEGVDRLDRLAYRYYKQPTKWWQLCEANPEFLFPQSLLGKDAGETLRIPLASYGGEPGTGWPRLRAALLALLTVESVRFEERLRLDTAEADVGGVRVIIHREYPDTSVIVTYNTRGTSREQVLDAVSTSGWTPLQPQVVGRIGKKIAIAPDADT
jgi:hypothetical protein